MLAESKKSALSAGEEIPIVKPDKDVIPIVIPDVVEGGTNDEVGVDNNLSYRSSVQDWNKPSDLAPDGKTFLDLFTSRWECYSKWPENVKQLDNLHNNFKDISVSSYFEIPTDPTTVLSEWTLPPNLRKNVYLDDIWPD